MLAWVGVVGFAAGVAGIAVEGRGVEFEDVDPCGRGRGQRSRDARNGTGDSRDELLTTKLLADHGYDGRDSCSPCPRVCEHESELLTVVDAAFRLGIICIFLFFGFKIR